MFLVGNMPTGYAKRSSRYLNRKQKMFHVEQLGVSYEQLV